MSEDLVRIRQFTSALARRERTLLLARVGFRASALAFGVLFLAVLAAATHWQRETAAAALVLLGGVGAFFAIGAPLLRQWRPAGDLVRQARLVEALKPDLRGRLLVAVDRPEGAQPSESEALLGLMARRAAAVLAGLSPRGVHSARGIGRWVVLTALGALATAVAWVASPLGVAGTWQWWFGGGFAAAALADIGEAEGERARVGDLVLRYVYPDYTGLDPHVIANATGDAHGPPGTIVEIVARSGDAIDAAAIVAYTDPALDATIGEDHRSIGGQFTIGPADGVWRILTWNQGRALASREFQIKVEPDLAPEVILDANAAKLEVAIDEPIPLQWRARDDYGIQRVTMEIDGKEALLPLATPLTRRAELDGNAAPTPASLGLAPGARVKLVIAAWDNDAVAGSKVGRSRVVQVVVLGANGLAQAGAERQRELRTLLIDLLAQHLVDRWPVSQTAGGYATWGSTVSKRYTPITDWYSETWGERKPRNPQERLERDVVTRVTTAGTNLVRFTQVGFDPGSTASIKPADLTETSNLREKAIVAIENGILALDELLQTEALRNVADEAERMGEVAERVKAALEKDMTAQQMLTQLDSLEAALRKMLAESAKLEKGGLREFVNARGTELQDLSAEIRKAIAEGRKEDAARLMKQLADELESMSNDVKQQMEQRQQGNSQDADDAKEAIDELQKLETEQRELQEQTKAMREKSDAKSAEKMESAWEKLKVLSAEHVASAEGYVSGLEAYKREFNEIERAGSAADASSRLKDAIGVRDLRGASRALDGARRAWTTSAWSYEAARRAKPNVGGPGTADLEQLQSQLDAIEKLLNQLGQDSQSTSPQTQQQAKELGEKQRDLEQRMQSAKEKAEEVGQKLTMTPEGLEEGLKQAEDGMKQAGEDLKNGAPMPAEGSQGAAAEGLKQARESLQQSLRQQQAMQQPQSGKDGEQQQGGKNPEDGDEQNDDPTGQTIELPDPEQFQTPEQYREELLEGMEGDVPEEYRALKKRYYEDLVNQ